MPVEYKKDEAVIQEAVSAEQAEGMLEWLVEKPLIEVDLAAARPLRAICPSASPCAPPHRRSWPHDAEMRAWLESALKPAP